MITQAPHFILYSESIAEDEAAPVSTATPVRRDNGTSEAKACWHFVLRSSDGNLHLDVADAERDATPERLELLAVVRGLEALDQPSKVTLVTPSAAIRRGLRFGLSAWRETQWQWERFGKMAPINNADLWQRIDRALHFHDIECRVVRVDPPVDDLARSMARSKILWRTDRSHMPQRSGRSQSRSSEPRNSSVAGSLWLPLAHLLHRLLGWCGLCRATAGPAIAAS